MNRRTAQEFTAFERTYVVMLACAAAFTLSALRTIKGDLAAYVRPLSDPKFLICVVVLSLFCSILCNNMVNYAAGKMSVVKLSSLGSLTTLCSMFAGVILLHEPLTPALLLGSVLILVGIRQVTEAAIIRIKTGKLRRAFPFSLRYGTYSPETPVPAHSRSPRPPDR